MCRRATNDYHLIRERLERGKKKYLYPILTYMYKYNCNFSDTVKNLNKA